MSNRLLVLSKVGHANISFNGKIEIKNREIIILK